jgi:hypothetical protein
VDRERVVFSNNNNEGHYRLDIWKYSQNGGGFFVIGGVET